MTTIAPGQSWQAAYASAKPGDIITLVPGLHPSVQLDRVSGRVGPPVIFKGGPGVEVQSLSSGKGGGSVTTPTGATNWGLKSVKVRGEITIRWGSNFININDVKAGNIRITSAEDVSVENCEFGPFVDQVATVNSAGGAPGVKRIKFVNCFFHDYTISNKEKHAEGMQIWPTAPSEDVWVLDCRFENCTDFDILVKAAALSGLRIEGSVFDVPMPGDQATVLCCPNCGPRWGSAIRLSTHQYPNAVIKGNIIKKTASIVVDNKTGVTNTGNIFVDELPPSGTIPVPPDPPDTLPPVITVPQDIGVEANDETGCLVNFVVSAVDNIDSTPEVVAVPPSGSVFPIGVTRVKVDASDDAGNTSTASFQVVVTALVIPEPEPEPEPEPVTTLMVRFYEGGTWEVDEIVVVDE